MPGYKKDKVATRVGYNKVTKEFQSWGEETSFSDATLDVYEQFKLTLDDRWHDARGYTSEEARKWYSAYLGCLHRHIAKLFDMEIPGWREMNVEYNFSTPTTWKRPGMIAGIEKMIKSSGFSSEHETVRMSLTEAEAAAIEATNMNYKPGEVFLICDVSMSSFLDVEFNICRLEVVPQT